MIGSNWIRTAIVQVALASAIVSGSAALAQNVNSGEPPRGWAREFPLNGFQKATVRYDEIMSGGPPRDGIPSIDNPIFRTIAEVENTFVPTEPVLSIEINGDARAYPLRILTWHEIVNDVVGGEPVTVTFCPLCNSGIAFRRTIDGRVNEFGVSGKLRNSDMVMYDRNTETFWQQFTGEGIIGPLTGYQLDMLPIRMESFQRFTERHPDGMVQIPNDPRMRNYGRNPYGGYDSLNRPFLYFGDLPAGIPPLARVIAIEDKAYALELLASQGQIDDGDLRLSWSAGQNSALDSGQINRGRDVGNVVVQRRGEDGVYRDEVHDVTFAFTFHAFRPEGEIVF